MSRTLTGAATAATHLAIAFVVAVLGLELAVRSTPLPSLERARATSRLVTAGSGELLWAFQTDGDRWRLPIAPHDVDPAYLDLLVAVEDQRFRRHRGVDVAALMRAGWQAVRHGRAVSGASTLTMQVVRLLEPKPRTLGHKVGEMLSALRLERSLGKDEILRLYLTLAPFGGNLEGIRAATLAYLGKEPDSLTRAETALLVAIPQSPETRRPDRRPEAAKMARDRLLTAAAARGRLPADEARAAAASPVPGRIHPLTRHAPHLALRLRAATPGDGAPIETLVDPALQAHVEAVASRAVRAWSDGVSVAAIVIRNRDGAVRAYLGGVDLRSEDRKGFVDLVQAVRSPGSTLKPLIYGMAFETLAVHPETIISDGAVEIAGYRPENADGLFAGDLTVRQALIRSRNTTAVLLLDRIGVPAFLARLRSTGRPLQLPGSDSAAGLAIALGGAGVTLEQLTSFYAAIADEGRMRRPRWRASDPPEEVGDLLSPAAARATADILGDVPAPPGFARLKSADGGRRIGYKTGTSYGFRDAWAVGFDRLHTVGIWVGRADGAAHLGAYGASAAAPILMRIFDRLPVPAQDVSPAKPGSEGLSSLQALPDRLKRFGTAGTERPLEIVFPKPGAELDVDRAGRASVQLPLSLAGGRSPYRWTLNGVAQPPTSSATLLWAVEGQGQFDVAVMDGAGVIARSSFWLH